MISSASREGMATRYAHVQVDGDWGIRLGKGNITIEIWDKKDRRVGSVTIGQVGVSVGGKRGRRRVVSNWDKLNR
jgi:hypothetical protein